MNKLRKGAHPTPLPPLQHQQKERQGKEVAADLAGAYLTHF